MTPKEWNEIKGVVLVFGPMIVIPVLLFVAGSFNFASMWAGPMVGILFGKIGLMFGVVK